MKMQLPMLEKEARESCKAVKQAGDEAGTALHQQLYNSHSCALACLPTRMCIVS